MFGINGLEFVVLAVITVLVIGPERLPEYAGQLGRLVKELRRMATGARQQLKDEVGSEFTDVDWQKLDPRQYDPRRIIREALLEDDEPVKPQSPNGPSSNGSGSTGSSRAIGSAGVAAGAASAAGAAAPAAAGTTASNLPASSAAAGSGLPSNTAAAAPAAGGPRKVKLDRLAVGQAAPFDLEAT